MTAEILDLNATERYVKDKQPWVLTVASQMCQAANNEALFTTTVAEIRKDLQVDRALIYRFQPENQGVVLAESVSSGYTPSVGRCLPAIAFGALEQLEYQQQRAIALEDIYQNNLNPYQIKLMERFQVKASLILPILLEKQVWGLLIVQQCSASRQWQEAEISLLHQIVNELTLVLQAVEFCTMSQQQSEPEKVLFKVFEIRVTQGLNRIVAALGSKSSAEVATTLRAEAEVFLTLAESLNLPKFATIARAAIAVLESHSEYAMLIARTALADFQEEQAAVLGEARKPETRGDDQIASSWEGESLQLSSPVQPTITSSII